VPLLAAGQLVELYPTIPSESGGSIDSGTRGIVREVDPTRPNDDIYYVAFLDDSGREFESTWLSELDVYAV
jgi:hypothetical protein